MFPSQDARVRSSPALRWPFNWFLLRIRECCFNRGGCSSGERRRMNLTALLTWMLVLSKSASRSNNNSKRPKTLSSWWSMMDQACNDEKLNLVTSSSSYPSPITMPNRLNHSKLPLIYIGPDHQGGLLPGGRQGEEDLPGEIPKDRLREALTTIITITHYYNPLIVDNGNIWWNDMIISYLGKASVII